MARVRVTSLKNGWGFGCCSGPLFSSLAYSPRYTCSDGTIPQFRHRKSVKVAIVNFLRAMGSKRALIFARSGLGGLPVLAWSFSIGFILTSALAFAQEAASPAEK